MRTLISLVLVLTVVLTPAVGLCTQKVRSLCEIHYPSDLGIPWSCFKLRPSDTPVALFGKYWKGVLRFNRMDRRHFFGGVSIKVPKQLGQVENFTPLAKEYAAVAAEAKFILVDRREMFLGAYEKGKLVFSAPVALGIKGHEVPTGTFRIDAVDRHHHSNEYTVEEIGKPYPMHYGLRFFVDRSKSDWPSYWIHGRDVPGYPASHGCIGLYDEEMQQEYYAAHDKRVMKENYHPLTKPYLETAKRLYKWVIGGHPDHGTFHKIDYGPRVFITG